MAEVTKKLTTMTPVTAWQAAHAVARWMRDNLDPDIKIGQVVAGKDRAREILGGSPPAAVILEGMYDWPMKVTEAVWANEIDIGDFWVEPVNGWALGVYPEEK